MRDWIRRLDWIYRELDWIYERYWC